MTIRDGNITFNNASIRSLPNVVYINILINEELRRLMVEPSGKHEKDALRWCVAKPDKRDSRRMRCPEFTDFLFKFMNWDKGYRYRALGYLVPDDDGMMVLVFDLVLPKKFKENVKIAESGKTTAIGADKKGSGDTDSVINEAGTPGQDPQQTSEKPASSPTVDRTGFFEGDI